MTPEEIKATKELLAVSSNETLQSIAMDLLATLEETEQQNKELQEANRSACESRDIAYRSRNDAIVTSNQHYAQLVEAQSVIREAQQTIALKQSSIETLTGQVIDETALHAKTVAKLIVAEQTIARQREALEDIKFQAGITGDTALFYELACEALGEGAKEA